MAQEQQPHESLENGQPLLQSRKLSCDASRKGLPWRSKRASVTKETNKSSPEQPEQQRKPRRKEKERRGDKKVYIASVKKAQFSHMLPDQRDSCIHQSPIIYQPKSSEQRRQEVAPLWYHPFHAA